MHSELKKFLIRVPQPQQIRTIDPDRLIEVPLRRGAWKEVESTIKAIDPSSIEALDKAGGVIRAMDLRNVESDEDKADKDADPTTSNKHLAAVLDAYGKRLIEAFNAGVAASSSQQDHLVALVEQLTAHLSHALTGLHRLSAQVATLQSASNAEDAVAQQLIGAALGGRLGAGANGANGANGG